MLSSLAILLMLAGCRNHQANANGGPPPVEVGVAIVRAQSIRQLDEFNGRVNAIDAVQLRARVSGYVQRIAFQEGGEVKQGDLLFVIDPRPYRNALDSATAQLERARAALILAQAQNKRAENLLKAKAISSEESETRLAGYAQGQADVHAAEAAVATAKLNLGFTEVRAPVSGRVSRALVTLGNLAVADQTLLSTVVSQDPIYVDFDPDEQTYLRYRDELRKRQSGDTANPVRVALANEEGFPHVGTLHFVDNQLDPSVGSIHARVLLANADRVFTPGLYARVLLGSSTSSNALLIDDKAVLTDQDRKYVYVVGPDNKALRKDIQIGPLNGGLRVVTAGLAAGDKLIVQGAQKIFFPGAPVKPTEVPMVPPSVAATAAK